ncbi:MAG: hypothetical protein HFJ48_01405 [Clostridia bacterium]|nr:hypothetical protein [Clostridia bacterium]
MLKEYHKIETLFERDEKTKKLIEGKYHNKTVEFLKDLRWQFTEKIDGTNIRIYWDGHRVSFYGRTDKAEIPAKLLNRLNELFNGEVNEQLFEQKFGETEVVLVGEGYGAKIQGCGSLYRQDQDFILFDVMIAENWQSRESVEDIASYFNIDTVPIVLEGTIQEAVDYVKTKPKSKIGIANSEGIVGRPVVEMQDRCGNRVIVKIKVRDFE